MKPESLIFTFKKMLRWISLLPCHSEGNKAVCVRWFKKDIN